MEPNLIFSLPNCLYWIILAGVIAGQGATVGESWPEESRWRLGVITLFGSGLVMVAAFGWHAYTWAGLTVLSFSAGVARVDQLLLGNLWERRESHRWTLRYFLAFTTAIPLLFVGFEVVTWLLLGISVGVCGAVKVGREAYMNSRRARLLRRIGPEDTRNGFFRR